MRTPKPLTMKGALKRWEKLPVDVRRLEIEAVRRNVDRFFATPPKERGWRWKQEAEIARLTLAFLVTVEPPPDPPRRARKAGK